MKLKSSKTSKTVATKKGKTGTTKVPKSRTSSKRTTSPTYQFQGYISNLKDTWTTLEDGNLSVSGDVIPASTLDFYLQGITQSNAEVNRRISIGPDGLVYQPSLGEAYRKIGWRDLDLLTSDFA